MRRRFDSGIYAQITLKNEIKLKKWRGRNQRKSLQ